MGQRQLNIVGSYAIPVGHRVRVTWYASETSSMSFLGKDKTDVEEIESPEVEDLTTGIKYRALSHVHEGGYRAGAVNVQSHQLLGNLVARETITGTVRACSLVEVRFEGRETEQTETELLIELD